MKKVGIVASQSRVQGQKNDRDERNNQGTEDNNQRTREADLPLQY